MANAYFLLKPGQIMCFRLAADAVLLLHLAFILFVVFGGALSIRRYWLAMIHLPSAAWGVFVELTGQICPLTYLENDLRRQAGQAGYHESFIEHYLLNIIYPAGLTPEIQYGFAGIVLVINLLFYGWLLRRRRGHTNESLE